MTIEPVGTARKPPPVTALSAVKAGETATLQNTLVPVCETSCTAEPPLDLKMGPVVPELRVDRLMVELVIVIELAVAPSSITVPFPEPSTTVLEVRVTIPPLNILIGMLTPVAPELVIVELVNAILALTVGLRSSLVPVRVEFVIVIKTPFHPWIPTPVPALMVEFDIASGVPEDKPPRAYTT